MNGYRQPDFDLDAGADTGPPLRPYNWVQWTGVALGLVGIAIDLAYLAGRAGWSPRLDSPSVGIALPLLGAALINTRRAPGPLSRPEVLRRRRNAALAGAGTAFVLGLVVAILIAKGA